MKTVEQFEKASYLSRRASGACYDYPTALSQLAEHMDVPTKEVWRMIGAGTIVRRRIHDGTESKVVIMSEDVVAAIKKLEATKRRQELKLVKRSRRVDTG